MPSAQKQKIKKSVAGQHSCYNVYSWADVSGRCPSSACKLATVIESVKNTINQDSFLTD